jgi:hypothetical protein
MRDLAKVNAAARKFVYFMTFTTGASLKEFHDELMEGIQEAPPKRVMNGGIPSHVLLFNRLTEMGIDPNVQYLPDGFTRFYITREDAYQDLQWLNIPNDKQIRFRENVDRYLLAEHGGYRLTRTTKTAILWWKK